MHDGSAAVLTDLSKSHATYNCMQLEAQAPELESMDITNQ